MLALHLLQVTLAHINTETIQLVLPDPMRVDRAQTEDPLASTPLIYAHVNPCGRFELVMEMRLPIDWRSSGAVL